MAILDRLLRAGVRKIRRSHFPVHRPTHWVPKRPISSILSSSRGRNALAVATAPGFLTTRDVDVRGVSGLAVHPAYKISEIPAADRRLWHPMGDARPVGVTERGAAQLISPNHEEFERQRRVLDDIHRRTMKRIWPQGYGGDWRLGFKKPNKVWICTQRWLRRKMMHILGIAGRRVARPRYRELSHVRCW